MVHRNAPLSETGRLRLARCVVEDGWPLRRAAERFQVSPTTAARWAGRYRQLGAGRDGRPVEPPHAARPTPARTERRIIGLRITRRLGPARIGSRLGLHPSTVHAVLRPLRLPRLAHLDRATGVAGPPLRARPARRPDPRRRQEARQHPRRRRLAHHGRASGNRNQATRPGAPARQPGLGYGYLHTALDDHSRLAYTEILADETKDTAAAFWTRAHAWFATAGITIERVLTDNGSCYRSHALAADLRRPGHQPQADPPLPAPDQRQSRTLPPHPGRRMGLRPPLHQRNRTPRRLAPGCTPTTITAATPHSAASHPPAASPTSLDRTPSPPSLCAA